MEKNLRKFFPLFVLPMLLAFSVAFVIPFVMGVYLSFCEFTTVTNATFVGFSNYAKVFADQDFLQALWFTVKVAVVTIASINIIAFMLAIFLTRGLKGTNVYRTVFFMPNLIGGVVLGYVWQCMINGALATMEITMLMDAKYGFWGLVILSSWQYIGYIMIIYIAGLQNVSPDLIEAAEIDGANKLQVLWKIKFPMIMSSFTICFFLTIMHAFKMFEPNLALTGGGPSGKTTMLALDIYETFYSRLGFEGVGQAKGILFFVIVASIALAQVVLTRRKEVES